MGVRGEGRGELREKVPGLRRRDRWSRNSHEDAKPSTGDTVENTGITTRGAGGTGSLSVGDIILQSA